MKYKISENDRVIPNDHGYTNCLCVVWDYQNAERNNDQWHSTIEMKDWLHGQFGLNRGYKFLHHSEIYSYILFKDRHDMILFRMVF